MDKNPSEPQNWPGADAVPVILKYGWRIAGTLFALALLAFGGFGTVSAFARSTATDVQTVSAAGMTQLHISNSQGDVTIAAGPSDVISISTTSRRALQTPSISIVPIADTLFVTGSCPTPIMFDCDVDFTITVPQALALTLSARHGDVNVAGLTGSVTVKSFQGDVALTSLPGPIRLTSTFGNVTGTALTSEDADYRVMQGALTLVYATAPALLNIQASLADVDVRLPQTEAGYAVERDTTQSDSLISVNQNQASPHRITLVLVRADATITS